MVEHFDSFPYALAADPGAPGSLYASFADGRVRAKPGPEEGWREVARVPGGVSAIAIVN